MPRSTSKAPITVQIVSDGVPERTHVQLPDGQEVPGIISMQIEAIVGEPMRVHLTVMQPHIDMAVQLGTVILTCPCCQTEIQHNCNETKEEVVSESGCKAMNLAGNCAVTSSACKMMGCPEAT